MLIIHCDYCSAELANNQPVTNLLITHLPYNLAQLILLQSLYIAGADAHYCSMQCAAEDLAMAKKWKGIGSTQVPTVTPEELPTHAMAK